MPYTWFSSSGRLNLTFPTLEDALASHDDNLERLVWLAANDVAEDPDTYAEEEQ